MFTSLRMLNYFSFLAQSKRRETLPSNTGRHSLN